MGRSRPRPVAEASTFGTELETLAPVLEQLEAPVSRRTPPPVEETRMTVRGAPRSRPRPTILRGTCLVHGRHPAGSREAAECPLLGGRITPEENTRRIGRPGTENAGGAIGVQAPEIPPPLPPVISGGSDTKNRDRAIAAGRAFTPGRPTHTPAALRLAARERQRRRRLKRRQGSPHPRTHGTGVTAPSLIARLGP